MLPSSWQAVYQGSPTIVGGNIVKSDWWVIGERIPKIKYRFLTADTAQKKNTWNDYTVIQAWGVCYEGRLHLLDMFRDRVEAPELLTVSKQMYERHNNIHGQPLRGFYIEDKSSGIGLIQSLRRDRLKVVEVPRSTDKITRAQNAGPEIKSGKVVLYDSVAGYDTIIDEASAFPNGINDDAFDCAMTAIEIELLSKTITDYSKLI
jgi:predicted phage terminase large subunit-like protein